MKAGCWIAVLCFSLGLPRLAAATTYTVTKTADSGDATLRWAIEAANTNPGPDTIAFSIAAAPYRIRPASALPGIFGGGGPVTLDGTTQPGYAGVPLVTLHGGTAGGEGLYVMNSTSVVIKALVITAWATGVKMQDCVSNRVENCHIWTNTFDGIYMQRTSWSVVGGSTNRGNLVASNGAAGAFILDNSRGNLVSGNRIGTDGLAALPNERGIYLADVDGTVIGGAAASNRNVISASINDGILLSSWASNTTISGNYIGTDQTGTNAMGNRSGVTVSGSRNSIGGASAGARNIISGNSSRGVDLSTADAHDNTVRGNWIGLGAGGQPCPNLYGVFVSGGASTNTIGGSAAGERNVISGNTGDGVYLDGATTTNNTVSGNYIGTGTSGLTRAGNAMDGVALRAPRNRIGGSAAGEGNLISGNGGHGISLANANSRGNIIRGNWIGVNATGNSAINNDHDGIFIIDVADTLIGGAGGAMNVISANGENGIFLSGSGCANTVIAGNRIGLAALFFADLGNGGAGVLMDAAPSNSVGTGLPGEANVIANNDGDGIRVRDSAAIRNRFIENSLYNNGGLGINLGTDGVTTNDPLDGDTGPNQYQN
ncbi:MAG TPA: right-handed parallel beta-helix repeat-containing protein [Kiritimatiellia bacterium]|nr:right-handed parallel beta-helix repeat-containing protein [Kiritimatiellia bacterium]